MSLSRDAMYLAEEMDVVILEVSSKWDAVVVSLVYGRFKDLSRVWDEGLILLVMMGSVCWVELLLLCEPVSRGALYLTEDMYDVWVEYSSEWDALVFSLV